jgi:hypothetical protein
MGTADELQELADQRGVGVGALIVEFVEEALRQERRGTKPTGGTRGLAGK